MLTSHKVNRGAFSFQINEIMTNAKNGCSGVVTSAKKKKKGYNTAPSAKYESDYSAT